MKYSPIHKSFTITQEEFELASEKFRWAMEFYREAAGVTLGKRGMAIPSTDFDHAEREMLQALLKIGIDFGVANGRDLDLSRPE